MNYTGRDVGKHVLTLAIEFYCNMYGKNTVTLNNMLECNFRFMKVHSYVE